MTNTATASKKRTSHDPVGLYLEEIGRHPLLTPQGEQQLARAIAAGRDAESELAVLNGSATPAQRRQLKRTATEGRQAAETFVNSNLRLVVSVAKRYQSSGVPLLDLMNTHTQVNKRTPPTLLVHSKDDNEVPFKNSELFYESLQKNGVKSKLLGYEQGRHAYAMGRPGTDSAEWPSECLKWFAEIGVIESNDG